MRPRRWPLAPRVQRLALATLLTTIAITTPAGAAPAGHGTGTDARFEGDTLVITFHLQIVHRVSADTGAMRAGLDAALAYWNEGFARYTYSGCFPIRLELDARFVPGHERDFDTPAHTVRTSGLSHVGEMADGRYLPSMYDRFAEPDLPGTEDYTGPFEHQVEGYWPPWLFEDPAGLAHEMGHLFGLGDDYLRDENGDTAPIEGREGTLMDSGDMIDELLAARVGDNVLVSGYDGEFPECWTGTLVGTGVNHPRSPSCEPAATYDYDVRIVVSANGVATLTGHGITGSSCSDITSENDLAATGTRTPEGISFPAVATMPWALEIRTDGSTGSGEGYGSQEGFEYSVTAELEQRFAPPAG